MSVLRAKGSHGDCGNALGHLRAHSHPNHECCVSFEQEASTIWKYNDNTPTSIDTNSTPTRRKERLICTGRRYVDLLVEQSSSLVHCAATNSAPSACSSGMQGQVLWESRSASFSVIIIAQPWATGHARGEVNATYLGVRELQNLVLPQVAAARPVRSVRMSPRKVGSPQSCSSSWAIGQHQRG